VKSANPAAQSIGSDFAQADSGPLMTGLTLYVGAQKIFFEQVRLGSLEAAVIQRFEHHDEELHAPFKSTGLRKSVPVGNWEWGLTGM
jgi:hypothetical protein